ncbi:unknown [Cryptophlebia leucotreta granulovirus]|uniref:Uncharacterized protein n=1 Tax=Cryptophlebia leucotreta granulosis virus TaxID=35254 RepID=Q7T5H2_GVCL|nr:hypothetical protein [Cryptophlebia leucotreta granulovirus]AAQ21716.1 unknown [Cryptophlebia leucotreta granulovirus]AUF82051.1 hypothetical protein [Cryptophlebia leucotreta granulovirus]
MFFITTQTECKSAAETIINEQFQNMECAICLNSINSSNKGVLYVTCGGAADLERAMCKECDKRFEKQDPYKREIEYRFEYPFVNNEHAKSFLQKSKTFVINDGEEEKIEQFTKILKSTTEGYQDVEFKLKICL